MILFTATDLSGLLRKTVTEASATLVEKVVWGWLKPILGSATRPNPVPDELFSWAIELGAIAYENPSGLSRKQIGPFTEDYSAERRAEILAEVAGSSLAAAGRAPLAPRGSFPEAACYPDRAW